jgi:biotin operon repressor
MIAEKLGVSVPTVSRDVTALRQRGHEIFAEKGSDGWRYVLREDASRDTRTLQAPSGNSTRRGRGKGGR